MKKRMYGGDYKSSLTINNEQDISEIPKGEAPTLGENVKAVGNLATSLAANVTADGIQKVAEYSGLNPNETISENVEKLGDKIEDIVEVLDSPEGEKLKREASELLADSIEILEPSLEKGKEIAKKSLKDLSETGTSIVITAANEIPPIFFINELSKFGTAAAQAGTAVSELTTTGTEAVESLEEQKKKAESLFGRAKDLFGNISQGINTGVSDVIKSAQENVNEYGKNVVNQGINNFPKAPEMSVTPEMSSNVNISPSVKTVGDSLKKYKNDRMMFGGRIKKSQLEFLTPHVNHSQILQQYGGNGKTNRRQYLKRKMTSRRR